MSTMKQKIADLEHRVKTLEADNYALEKERDEATRAAHHYGREMERIGDANAGLVEDAGMARAQVEVLQASLNRVIDNLTKGEK